MRAPFFWLVFVAIILCFFFFFFVLYPRFCHLSFLLSLVLLSRVPSLLHSLFCYFSLLKSHLSIANGDANTFGGVGGRGPHHALNIFCM